MTVDELDAFGMRQMDGDDIERTLSKESVGVLGVPTGGAPMLRPLSYWYDGEDALYFVYVLGGDSEKKTLSDRAEAAQFLVYHVDAPFNWRSVLVTGRLKEVPEAERDALEERLDISWRPDLFEREDGWHERAKLLASDADGPDELGYSVAVSGDGSTALVGAHDDTNENRKRGSGR